MKSLWLRLRNDTRFVTAYSVFDGFFLAQLQAWWANGHTDWSLIGWGKMAGTAAVLTVFALYHLKMPAPGTNPNP
jgi:hypothetical protein